MDRDTCELSAYGDNLSLDLFVIFESITGKNGAHVAENVSRRFRKASECTTEPVSIFGIANIDQNQPATRFENALELPYGTVRARVATESRGIHNRIETFAPVGQRLYIRLLETRSASRGLKVAGGNLDHLLV